MRIIKPTFESFLAETKRIYIRMERKNRKQSLVAGGFDSRGYWIEYLSRIEDQATLNDISKCLEVMVYMIEEENKEWQFEQRLDQTFRKKFCYIEWQVLFEDFDTATWLARRVN